MGAAEAFSLTPPLKSLRNPEAELAQQRLGGPLTSKLVTRSTCCLFKLDFKCSNIMKSFGDVTLWIWILPLVFWAHLPLSKLKNIVSQNGVAIMVWAKVNVGK